MRRGHTLPELLLVLAVVTLLFLLALPRGGRTLDGLLARQAADRIVAAHGRARSIALARQRVARLLVSADSLQVVSADSVIWRLAGPSVAGAALEEGSGETSYAPNGQAMGAANARYLLRRGTAAVEVLVSRLGRVRAVRIVE
jgi:prepilin-type N-terminal cleavage/methylation domain-containing protein